MHISQAAFARRSTRVMNPASAPPSLLMGEGSARAWLQLCPHSPPQSGPAAAHSTAAICTSHLGPSSEKQGDTHKARPHYRQGLHLPRDTAEPLSPAPHLLCASVPCSKERGTGEERSSATHSPHPHHHFWKKSGHPHRHAHGQLNISYQETGKLGRAQDHKCRSGLMALSMVYPTPPPARPGCASPSGKDRAFLSATVCSDSQVTTRHPQRGTVIFGPGCPDRGPPFPLARTALVWALCWSSVEPYQQERVTCRCTNSVTNSSTLNCS